MRLFGVEALTFHWDRYFFIDAAITLIVVAVCVPVCVAVPSSRIYTGILLGLAVVFFLKLWRLLPSHQRWVQQQAEKQADQLVAEGRSAAQPATELLYSAPTTAAAPLTGMGELSGWPSCPFTPSRDDAHSPFHSASVLLLSPPARPAPPSPLPLPLSFSTTTSIPFPDAAEHDSNRTRQQQHQQQQQGRRMLLSPPLPSSLRGGRRSPSPPFQGMPRVVQRLAPPAASTSTTAAAAADVEPIEGESEEEPNYVLEDGDGVWYTHSQKRYRTSPLPPPPPRASAASHFPVLLPSTARQPSQAALRARLSHTLALQPPTHPAPAAHQPFSPSLDSESTEEGFADAAVAALSYTQPHRNARSPYGAGHWSAVRAARRTRQRHRRRVSRPQHRSHSESGVGSSAESDFSTESSRVVRATAMPAWPDARVSADARVSTPSSSLHLYG